MTHIEAMKQALEAAYLAGFNANNEGYDGYFPINPEKHNLWLEDRDNYIRQAIATEESSATQEPVVWGVDWGKAGDVPCVSIIKRKENGGIEVIAVEYAPYTHPQQKAEQFWQHNCTEEGQIGIKKGQSCDWCGATEPKREWVGLTLDERLELAQDVDWAAGAYCEYAEAIEAKLKEKNA